MAFITADRVRDTTTTTGTGPVTVSGSAPLGHRTFSAVCAINDALPYFIAHQFLNEWEVGYAVYNATNQLTRSSVRASSNADAAVDFSAGTKDVALSVITSSLLLRDDSGGLNVPFGYGEEVTASVTQLTSRTTAVTCDGLMGRISMFSAAGSTTAATFTVNNNMIWDQWDAVLLSVASSTNKYDMAVTRVTAGAFDITFRTFSGTATDNPEINFFVFKVIA